MEQFKVLAGLLECSVLCLDASYCLNSRNTFIRPNQTETVDYKLLQYLFYFYFYLLSPATKVF